MMMPQQPRHIKPEHIIVNMTFLTFGMMFSVITLGVALFLVFQPTYDVHQFAEQMTVFPYNFIFFAGVVLLLVRVPIANTLLAANLKRNDGTQYMAALQGYFISHVLRIALAEAAAICGFMITIQTKEVSFFVILAAAALVAIVREIPTQERIRERIKAVRGDFRF